MQIVIATHGNYAAGLFSALKVQGADKANVSIIAAYTEDDDFEACFDRVISAFNKEEEIVVLTDLLGGSVNQIAMKYSLNRKLWIISGVNLPLVINATLLKVSNNLEKQISMIVEQSREQLLFINPLLNK